MHQVNNRTLSLRDAMRGVKVSVSFPREPSPTGFINMDESGAIKTGKEAGFMIEILDAVAERAGFTWRSSYALYDLPDQFGKCNFCSFALRS